MGLIEDLTSEGGYWVVEEHERELTDSKYRKYGDLERLANGEAGTILTEQNDEAIYEAIEDFDLLDEEVPGFDMDLRGFVRAALKDKIRRKVQVRMKQELAKRAKQP